ncbi:MAG: ADP-ribosylglycohydrolase family protein [Archangium sp.]
MSIDESKARGVLWGQAVGDALGTTVEFCSEANVTKREVLSWPREVIGGGPFDLLPGQVTDDTELALALARSLVERGGYDEDDVARSYLAWLASDPPDRGNATTMAFGKPVKGDDVAAQVRARASQKTEANGSLMRVSPLGVFGARSSRVELAALAMKDSALSHPAAVCQQACAVFVTTIADAVTSTLSGPELFERAMEFAGTHAPLVVSTLERARIELPTSDGDDQGWVRIALQHAFFHLLHASDFESALMATVLKGGDSDTNGCITGALLGAVFGVEAIPARWRDVVHEARPARPLRYRCHDLDALAATLIRP